MQRWRLRGHHRQQPVFGRWGQRRRLWGLGRRGKRGRHGGRGVRFLCGFPADPPARLWRQRHLRRDRGRWRNVFQLPVDGWGELDRRLCRRLHLRRGLGWQHGGLVGRRPAIAGRWHPGQQRRARCDRRGREKGRPDRSGRSNLGWRGSPDGRPAACRGGRGSRGKRWCQRNRDHERHR